MHELGHLVVGWCMGFRFVSAKAGPLVVAQDPKQVALPALPKYPLWWGSYEFGPHTQNA